MKHTMLFVLILAVALTAASEERDSVYVTVDRDTVTVWDIGARLNCASLYVMETRLSHDTLYVEQTDTVRNKARCICTFDFCARVTGLASGSYQAVVCRVLWKKYSYPVDTVLRVGSVPFVVSAGTPRMLTLLPFQSGCTDMAGETTIEPPPPSGFQLGQNFPNPFNPGTSIRFDIQKTAHVRLAVYDLLGRELDVLVDEDRTPGRYDAHFSGKSLASGVYVYRLSAGSHSATRMMQLIR